MTVVTSFDYNENNAEQYFENEQFSDIRFEVGPENDSWSVPAHKRILQKACPAFEPLLQQNFVRLEAIDKRAFSTFLRFLYTSKVEFSSIQTARETLNICYQFVCTTLAKKAVYFLDLNLNKFNVLDVYKNLQFLCNNIPSAPTFDNNNSEKAQMPLGDSFSMDKRNELHEICNSLLYNCLLEIDANMSCLLKNEKMLDFNLKDLLLIFQRDTLKINSELELLTFLDKWACCECKNRNLSLAIENKRELLKTLFVTIRFGTLTKKEFQQNTIIKNGLLLHEHYDAILNAIENPRGQLKKNNNILGIFYSLVTPRNYLSLTPVVISERSAAISKNRSSISNRSEPSGKLLNFLRVWSCLFD